MTFDLERARGLRDFLQDDCAEVGDVWGEMIAEIERLRPFEIAARDLDSDLTKIAGDRDEHAARIKELEADLEQAERVIEARSEVIDQQAALTKSLKKEIRRLKHESKVEQEFTNSYIKRLHDAEARIKELGSSLDEAEALTKKNAELMNGYLRRIAELEDALVEGLTNFLHYRASCYDPARRCPYAKECDDCSTWDACGHVEKFRSEAHRRLQAEGKIGNSEHFTDASKMIWQITEERKAAIWHAVAVLKENDPDDEHLWDEEIAVLRTMLTEAE